MLKHRKLAALMLLVAVLLLGANSAMAFCSGGGYQGGTTLTRSAVTVGFTGYYPYFYVIPASYQY